MRVLVVIRCPKTGHEVPTGTIIEIEHLHTLPLLCPACGEKHHWSVKDALLAHASSGGEDAGSKGDGTS